MEEILKGLNNKQYEAVINTEGPCLIIAGAGSGKTKVLTHKIAYLISEKDVKPWKILAITFTNKAANEMKTRVEALVGDIAKDMWIGTFHSICVRILRKQIDEKAKKRLNQHFVENHKEPLEHQSMDTETMYQQMKEQECQLLEEVAMMKEKQLNSK